ncbi:CvpA family protein [Thauera mechernichensis]|uniref:CvpA family protein n=1 Tax=Thauera mechernichensis TaxID=82788 RepID=A0ABW3WGM2_9RHOO|nr:MULTISPECIES: CvpA family protein [Thauera]ENO82971.1 colicin V production protein [Thauera sp. 27]ENO94764.1 colicin V production protein [Thauera sp. 28]MDG3063856.1 CvpA family protein [Thauera mechernichensis]WBL65678.1 CvpA family protein [Thauera sp. WB-2]HAY09222.1 colicin V production protein [Thauera sp.]
MTVFDYVFLGVLGFSAAIGMWRGLVSEVVALLAWVAALFAAWRYNEQAAAFFTGMIVEPVWRQVAGGALVVVAVLLIAALLRYLLRELLRAAGLGATDRFFGALFGVARGLAVAFVVVLVGGIAGVAREPWWSQALFSAPMESAVIAAKPWLPDEVADKIRFR